MTKRWRTLIACGVVVGGTVMSGDSQACQGIPATELVQMPPFCWEECSDKKISGPEYRIDRTAAGCGPGSNHYCFALMHLGRAKRTVGDKKKKLVHLRMAQSQIRYTMNGIAKFPNCAIRDHVNKTWNEVNAMLVGLGEK